MKKIALSCLMQCFTLGVFAQQNAVTIEKLLAYPDTQCETSAGFKLAHKRVKDKNDQVLQVLDKKGNIISETLTYSRKYAGKAQDMYAYTFAQLSTQSEKIQLTLYEGQNGFSKGIDEGTKSVFVLNSEGQWQKIQETRYREKIIAN